MSWAGGGGGARLARWGVAWGSGWCSVEAEVGLARFAPAVLAWGAIGCMGRSSMVVMSLKVVAMAAARGSQFLEADL